jgi:hypothetical protein
MLFGGVAFLNGPPGGKTPWLNITGLYSASKVKDFENVRMMSYHNIF